MKITSSMLLNIILLMILSASFFLVNTTANTSKSEFAEGYDPWVDLNDDGRIDLYDAVILLYRYGTKGTAINKTEVLLELLDKVNSLNSTVIVLNQKVEEHESTIIELQSRLKTLEAFEVNSTYSRNGDYINSTSWVDMDGMSLNVSLQRTSHVLILFSTMAEIINGHGRIEVRACINDTIAQPDEGVFLNPIVSQELCPLSCHRHDLEWASYSYTFYQPLVEAGNYTIRIQWKLYEREGDVEAQVWQRTFTVLAFPIE